MGEPKRWRAKGVAIRWADDPRPFEVQNEGWLTRVRRGRPFVRVKVALTLDGRPALAARRRSRITRCRRETHDDEPARTGVSASWLAHRQWRSTIRRSRCAMPRSGPRNARRAASCSRAHACPTSVRRSSSRRVAARSVTSEAATAAERRRVGERGGAGPPVCVRRRSCGRVARHRERRRERHARRVGSLAVLGTVARAARSTSSCS